VNFHPPLLQRRVLPHNIIPTPNSTRRQL
jgi:hypothetical protein